MRPPQNATKSVQPGTSPGLTLEVRLGHLVRRHLSLDPDQVVGHLLRLDDQASETHPPPVRARAWLGPAGSRAPRLGRTFWLDGYSLQVIADDVRRLGREARLDLVVARSTPAAVIEGIRRRLASLVRRGIDVRVRIERRRRTPTLPGEP